METVQPQKKQRRRGLGRPLKRLTEEEKVHAVKHLIVVKEIVNRAKGIIQSSGTLRAIDEDFAHDMAIDEFIRIVTSPKNQAHIGIRVTNVAINAHVLARRRRKREPINLGDDEKEMPSYIEATTWDAQSPSETAEDFEHLLKPLEDQRVREVLRRLYFLDQDYHEIAESLGISQSGVRKIEGRAMRKLRGSS